MQQEDCGASEKHINSAVLKKFFLFVRLLNALYNFPKITRNSYHLINLLEWVDGSIHYK